MLDFTIEYVIALFARGIGSPEASHTISYSCQFLDRTETTIAFRIRLGSFSLFDEIDSRKSSFDAQIPSHVNFIFPAKYFDFVSSSSNGFGSEVMGNMSQRKDENPSAPPAMQGCCQRRAK